MADSNGRAELAIQYRRRHLRFLSTLSCFTGVTMGSISAWWGLFGAAVACFIYVPVCLFTIISLRREPAHFGWLANLFIGSTLLVTLGGIFFQRPDAIIDPWIMCCPVVAYDLCERKNAAGWTALTLFSLFAIRPYQIHGVALQSTILLALAVVAIAIVLHLYSRHIEDNERLIVQLSNTDSLTGALNRRAFHEILQSEYHRNLRQQLSMTVFMIDADFFKRYNDHYGHIEGDKALAAIAQGLKHAARRAGEYVFRYGGEEFCVLCSGLDPAQAAAFAEQLRASIAALDLPHEDSPLRKLSISVGYRHIETLKPLNPIVLVEEADKALYLAKAKGRNRSERYQAAAC